MTTEEEFAALLALQGGAPAPPSAADPVYDPEAILDAIVANPERAGLLALERAALAEVARALLLERPHLFHLGRELARNRRTR